MKKLKELIYKFCTKEIIFYAIFGILTTIVNIGLFAILNSIFHINNNIANNISIIVAVLFAYFSNKDLVFHSDASTFNQKLFQFFKFILGRIFTMIIESVGCAFLFKYLPIPSIYSKCIITIIVIILNFFISKFFAFKKS